ncbi:E3 ubiquitin-protein ligase RFI2-like [Impatiens glandulifera]|uniref:E3 ubiquitin-protein ligase RFI2-like n=1 Tax=Impatiens glandulifera TaxID=253017 RepID=UPI001FB08A35|nr:E3 ubiquitin-protein ligase RFI2-like [Impatiens glandulifera]
MGLKDFDHLDAVDDGRKSSPISCSICLDAVTDVGERSWAKLHCGHHFHLDCIGSAFNAKGAMQCPNCRRVEEGQWLFANGCRPYHEFSMDDLSLEEDLYDIIYSEMSVGLHWHPYRGLGQLHSSLDEGELSSIAYHDLLGHQAIFGEHAVASSSATQPCPYVAYLRPIQASTSSSLASASDSATSWNGPLVPVEMHTSYSFPAVDLHYHHGWDHHSHQFPTTSSRASSADHQPSISSVSQRAARSNPDMARSGSYMHPFVMGQSSTARAGSSIGIPHYPSSVARAREHVQSLQAYFQQPTNSTSAHHPPVVSNTRRSTRRSTSSSSSDQTGAFYYYPSGTSRNFQESANHTLPRFRTWDRDSSMMPPSLSLEQDNNREQGWGMFHQPAGGGGGGGGSDNPMVGPTGFRQRHGSGRMPSQRRS